MKHFTSKFWMARAGVGLALLLVIGLAGASAGAVTFDSTPISPTIKATEILEGTVSSVTAPASNGVGPVFSILQPQETL